MSSVRQELPSQEEIAQLPPDGGAEFNRLIHEQSPYLLQHARNPVDWWPWGDAAFAEAARLDKPVFLSVGYSTCHWCHVMEHESFEDEAVAGLMNEAFVCIKVDREERPDIDGVYMTVTQAMTGQGGWPMTVLLTPNRKPFFAGTYFPKMGMHNRPGMLQLVPAIANAWQENREKIDESADTITERLKGHTGGAPGAALGQATLAAAYDQLADRYDAEYGGFGRAPKFPTPHNLNFLLRAWQRSGDEHALDMARHTALQMRRGGVYDHLGFGIHRYSTDREWLVPHFEKMLYDQALVMLAHCELYQATGDERHAMIVAEIATYVGRDMTDAATGGFYCAEDADSEGVEGVFYLWTREQVIDALGETDGTAFCETYQITPEGNYVEEATRHRTGQSIPHRALNDMADFRTLDQQREKLFELRTSRIHPYKDDKILTDWNGLMIAALSYASRIGYGRGYLDMVTQTAEFVWTTLRDADGRLLKRYRQGQAGLPAHLEDYVYVAWGYIELYQAGFEPKWLQRAIELMDHALDHFWDTEGGGFFRTADYGEPLIVRAKDVYDGAQPSGNSVAALNLLRLHALTGTPLYAERAEQIFTAFSGDVEYAASAHCHLMMAVDFMVGPSHELVIVGDPDATDTAAMLAAIRQQFLPRLTVILKSDGTADELAELAPFTAAMTAIDGQATAYVCSGFACQQPTTDPAEMLANLGLDG